MLLVAILVANAQHSQPGKTDAVCQLVKQYFNENSAEKIYELTGETFRAALSKEAFKHTCEQSLFPLGKMNEVEFDSLNNGVSIYTVTFNSIKLSLWLSLDQKDKIEQFGFVPYTKRNEMKSEKPVSSNRLHTALDKAIDSAVQPYIMQQPTVGLSIGILIDGKMNYYNYGETARGNKQLPNEHTIFEIGSITKTFTAILLADAVLKGKLQLNDPINRYLPDSIPILAFQGTPITIQSLSNHSSGIPRMPSNFYSKDIANPYNNYNLQDLYSFYKHFKPTIKPGEIYEYSNLAVATLGVILEKVNNSRYEALFLKTICHPLHMTETRQLLLKGDSSSFAKGYDATGGYAKPWDFKTLYAAGGIRSTCVDMLKFAAANLGNAPAGLKKAIQLTHSITFEKDPTKIGLGWHFIKPGKDEIIFHNGETGGYHSYLAINESKKFACVILSNCGKGTEEVGNEIMRWLESNK